MVSGRLFISCVSIGSILLAFTPALAQTSSNAPTFTKDIAPIFQAKCESCHRPDQMAPMSLVTYEEVRPWVRVDRGAHQRTADAAVAHRQDGRHPEVQERPIAFRRSDRHDREVGGGRGAEGRSEGSSAAGTVVRRLEVAGGRQFRAAGPRDHLYAVHDAGHRAGRMVEADRCRPA